MRKYFLVIILILFFSLIGGCIKKEASGTQNITKDKVKTRLIDFKNQYQDKLSQGYELIEAENFAMKAKQAYDAGDYNLANQYLDQAYQKLGDAQKPEGITPIATTVITVNPGASTPEPSGYASAPPQYKDFNDKTTLWLDKKLAEWKPATYKPIDFAAYHVFASDDMFVKSNEELDIKFLDVLEQTNSSIIVLYIRPNNYFSQKGIYDAIINKIRTDGKKLFIGARFDNTPMDFKKYNEELTAYTKNIIASIKPDYYGIVIEPSTMGKKHGFVASDEEWVESVKKISELSKQLSPNTKTVVAGHKQELKFLQMASDINSIDIMGFNIYDMSGIYSEYSGYLGEGDVVGKTIDYVNSKGKETWILETWVTDITTSKDKQVMGSQEFMKPIDAKWVQVITYYAQKHNMKAVTPFFTGKFIAYTNDATTFIVSLNNKDRTPVYQSYKNIIRDYNSLSKG